jgi:hypothetical protein
MHLETRYLAGFVFFGVRVSILIICVITICLVAAALFALISDQFGNAADKGGASEHSYCKHGPLLTPAERLFYKSLEQAVNGQYLIMCKARLADVITPKSSGDRSKWQSAFNKISGKHFDFVLCEPESFTVVAAVELDDKSHQNKSAQKRDKVKNDSCKSAGLALIRIPAKRRYDLESIRGQLAASIPLDIACEKIVPPLIAGTEQVARAPRTESAAIQGIVPAAADPGPDPELLNADAGSPLCPKCGSSTILRKVSKGKSAGKMFWVCSDFPRCRGAKPQQQ